MDNLTRKRYISLVNFLGDALGPNYEVVLQEFGSEYNGIIAIKNSGISGREVGGQPTGTALKMIMQKTYLKTDSVLNYLGILNNGKIVRSSTFFIKDNDQLLGMLCINYDSSKLQEFNDLLLRQFHPDEFLIKNGLLSNRGNVNPDEYLDDFEHVEYFQKDTESLMNELMSKEMHNYKSIETLGPKDRQMIVNSLYNRGMFKIKGSIEFVSDYLRCSQVSVYRYLKKASKNQ